MEWEARINQKSTLRFVFPPFDAIFVHAIRNAGFFLAVSVCSNRIREYDFKKQ